MNEKITFDYVKTHLFAIVLFIVALWAVSASIAAGIFYHGRNTARAELSAIKEAPVVSFLQSDIDSIARRNAELERFNRELSTELRTAADAGTKLAGIINNAAGLAESGRKSLRDAGQSVSGIAGTVNELRNNYQRLAELVIASERNYSAIIGELNRGTAMVNAY
jgi:hypothetical protein